MLVGTAVPETRLFLRDEAVTYVRFTTLTDTNEGSSFRAGNDGGLFCFCVVKKVVEVGRYIVVGWKLRR